MLKVSHLSICLDSSWGLNCEAAPVLWEVVQSDPVSTGVRLESRTVPLSRTGTRRGRLTMPSVTEADPHFPPVRLPTGSRQEISLSTGAVIVAFYCLSGDLVLLLAHSWAFGMLGDEGQRFNWGWRVYVHVEGAKFNSKSQKAENCSIHCVFVSHFRVFV